MKTSANRSETADCWWRKFWWHWLFGILFSSYVQAQYCHLKCYYYTFVIYLYFNTSEKMTERVHFFHWCLSFSFISSYYLCNLRCNGDATAAVNVVELDSCCFCGQRGPFGLNVQGPDAFSSQALLRLVARLDPCGDKSEIIQAWSSWCCSATLTQKRRRQKFFSSNGQRLLPLAMSCWPTVFVFFFLLIAEAVRVLLLPPSLLFLRATDEQLAASTLICAVILAVCSHCLLESEDRRHILMLIARNGSRTFSNWFYDCETLSFFRKKSARGVKDAFLCLPPPFYWYGFGIDPLPPAVCAFCPLFVSLVFTYLLPCFYREPFKSDGSAQTDGGAGSLWDDGSVAAGGSRVETNQPVDVAGEERHLNTSWKPNNTLCQFLCSVGMKFIMSPWCLWSFLQWRSCNTARLILMLLFLLYSSSFFFFY